MELSEFREWEASVKERVATTIEWINLVASYKHDAPTHLLKLYEDAFPSQKDKYKVSELQIEDCYGWSCHFELVQKGLRVRLFYTINKELYFGPHRSPYPVENKTLWPWTSLEYECPKFDKHVWFKIISFVQDVRFWLRMSIVSKQFHKWIKTDCGTKDFPLWKNYQNERSLCFGVKPLVKLTTWEFAVLASNITRQFRTKLGLLLIACCEIPFGDLHKIIHTKNEDVAVQAGSDTIYAFREKGCRKLTLKFSNYGGMKVGQDYFQHLSRTLCETGWPLGLQRQLLKNSSHTRRDQLLLALGDDSPNKRLKK
jgi:hypothetical protein